MDLSLTAYPFIFTAELKFGSLFISIKENGILNGTGGMVVLLYVDSQSYYGGNFVYWLKYLSRSSVQKF